jgi:hypothetical protein
MVVLIPESYRNPRASAPFTNALIYALSPKKKNMIVLQLCNNSMRIKKAGSPWGLSGFMN